MEPTAPPKQASTGSQPLAGLWSRHGFKLLTVLPLAWLIFAVARYGVDVPFWDQWSLVPLLEKMDAGTLTFSDLCAQHNEHRPLFAKAIMLGLARLTHWNVLIELAVNILLALGVLAVLAWQFRATEQRVLPRAHALRWALPAAALIVFSLSQYQNWLWGWQIQMLLNVLAAVAGIAFLAHPGVTWRRASVSALLGIVATYSFANGLLFWPLGLVVLFFATKGGKERTASLVAWLLVSALVTGSYLWRYQKPPDHPPPSLALDMPLAYVSYVFKFLGGIGAQYFRGPLPGQQAEGQLALVVGVLGTLALCWAAGTLVWQRRATLEALLPYLALAAYSVGSALITGVGRVGFGSDEALESRYCTLVVPFWVSLVVFLLLLLQGNPPPKSASARKSRPTGSGYDSRLAAGSLLLGTLALLGLSSLWAMEGAANLSSVQAYCRGALLDLATRPGAVIDYSDFVSQGAYAKALGDHYPFLWHHRLSLFRDTTPH